LIDSHWQAGLWHYRTIEECPGTLTVNDIHGQRKTLCKVEASEAKEMLGIFLAPCGSMEGEYNKLKGLAHDWVEKMQQGNLNRSEIWVALQSTVWRTLSYPLPAINLSKAQWETI
jgi:hypothetical protein